MSRNAPIAGRRQSSRASSRAHPGSRRCGGRCCRELVARRWHDRERSRTGVRSPSEAQRRLDRPERLNTKGDVLVEGHTQLLGPLANLVAVHAAREGFVLELLLDGRNLQIGKTLRGAHEGAGNQESTQLVDREERLRQRRVARYAGIGGVSENRPAERLRDSARPQDADAPGGGPPPRGMLLIGKLFVIEVVQQTARSPRLRISAEFRGVGPHRRLDRLHVLAQRGALRVLVHECERFFARHDPMSTPPTPQRSAHNPSINWGHSRRAWLRFPDRCSARSGVSNRRSASGANPVLSQRATGTDKPRFRRLITLSGTRPRAASFNIALVVRPRTLSRDGAGKTSSMTSRSRNGARASTDASMVARSTLTSRSSGK